MKSWNYLAILGAFLVLNNAHATTAYPVQDFSPDYHATVTINGNLKDVFLPGVVQVYNGD